MSDTVADPRPGPLAWVAIVAGWGVIAFGVLGAVGDERLGDVGSWALWLLGGAVVHDAMVLPAVLAVGALLAWALPPPWRTPLRWALVVAATVTLTVWPIARRWGARADNPSILPVDVARNLALIVTALLVVGAAAGAVGAWKGRHRPERVGAPTTPTQEDHE